MCFYVSLLLCREKKEYLTQFMNPHTKKFSVHGQHLTYEAMRTLFGASNSLVSDIKGTDHSKVRRASRNITGHNTGEPMYFQL